MTDNGFEHGLNVILVGMRVSARRPRSAPVPALLLSGVWPVVELVFTLIRNRTVDEFSMIVLIFLLVGVVSMLAFNSPRMVLIKDSAVTGLFGLVLLGSLLAPRPLMFYFGRKFATNGTPERIAWWNSLWQYQGFRRAQRVLTVVWGVAFLGEAVVRVALSFVLPISTMVVVTNVLPYVVLAALIYGTTLYGKRSGRATRAAAAGGSEPSAAPVVT